MERSAEERAEWAATLKHVGVYYEGLVDDAESIVEHCKLESVTTFGVRTSRGNSSSTAQQNALRQSGDQAESQKENKVLTV